MYFNKLFKSISLGNTFMYLFPQLIFSFFYLWILYIYLHS